MVCEVIPIYVDVVHVTTNVTVRHWNEIFLCRPRILPAPVTHIENVSTYVNKSRIVDCPRVISFDASSTLDPDFIHTDIAYMIYNNFLMVLTNSLSDIPSKLESCFYVSQTMFLTVNFLHPTENLIQCPFQQAGILFFGSWCFCIISKRSYVLNNFRNYFHAKAFKNLSRSSLTIFSYAF